MANVFVPLSVYVRYLAPVEAAGREVIYAREPTRGT